MVITNTPAISDADMRYTPEIPYGIGTTTEVPEEGTFLTSAPKPGEDMIMTPEGTYIPLRSAQNYGRFKYGKTAQDPVITELYGNAARQADIYKKIKTRLDDPSNDLLEELERQWEVEYESKRQDLINKENGLLDRAKAEGWDDRRTSFLRDSLYAKFAEDDMKLKGKYANIQQQWGFIDKEVARRVRVGEINSRQAEELARNLKMRELNYEFPGTVRSEIDREVALAYSEQLQRSGKTPQDADWIAGVPASVHRQTGQGTNEEKLAKFNELRGRNIPAATAAYQANLNLSQLGVTAGELADETEEWINERFGPPTGAGVSDVNAPATGGGGQGAAGPDAATGLFQMFPGLPPHIQAKIRQAISVGVPMEKLMTSPDLQPYLSK